MRILAGTGGAAHSDTAVRQAAYLAQKTNSQLTILTVIHGEANRPQAKAILTRATTIIAPYQIVPHTQIGLGPVAPEIVKIAKTGQYDLVVLGERPGHGLIKRLIGPTAEGDRVYGLSSGDRSCHRNIRPWPSILLSIRHQNDCLKCRRPR